MPEHSAGQSEQSTQPKYDFFVYIIESPSAPDLYHGRSEGGLVAQTIGLDLIPCVARTAINTEAFVAALRIGLPEAMKQCPGRYPILHLSAHGGTEGIQLSSGEIVTWADLRELLVPINQSLQGALLLCMSACEGYSACRMAMEINDAPHPYFAMIGNFSTPTWSDTAVSYLSFYHLVVKGRSIREAVEAMKIASGDSNWIVQTADEIKQSYIGYVQNKVQPAVVQGELQAAAEEEPLPPSAKALEAGRRG
jgi:hypothetical protein